MKSKRNAASISSPALAAGIDAQFHLTEGDKLLTTKQVSDMVGKSEAWLVRKRWEGNGIPYRKIGRHVRYQQSVVLAWLNNQPVMASTSGEI